METASEEGEGPPGTVEPMMMMTMMMMMMIVMMLMFKEWCI
jgi:hypothetical protein